MDKSELTTKIIKKYLDYISAITKDFQLQLYSGYDQELNGVTDPEKIESILNKADESSDQEIKKLKQKLTTAKKKLIKDLEQASVSLDTTALADLEKQIENL